MFHTAHRDLNAEHCAAHALPMMEKQHGRLHRRLAREDAAEHGDLDAHHGEMHGDLRAQHEEYQQ